MTKRLSLSLLCFFLIVGFAGSAQASILGWVTTRTLDWRFIQGTGGIKIAEPLNHEGVLSLPVTYDISGCSTVTCKPTMVNSGMAVRKISLHESKGKIRLRVISQVAEPQYNLGKLRYLDLSSLKKGIYEVYYGDVNDATAFLGNIEIK